MPTTLERPVTADNPTDAQRRLAAEQDQSEVEQERLDGKRSQVWWRQDSGTAYLVVLALACIHPVLLGALLADYWNWFLSPMFNTRMPLVTGIAVILLRRAIWPGQYFAAGLDGCIQRLSRGQAALFGTVIWTADPARNRPEPEYRRPPPVGLGGFSRLHRWAVEMGAGLLDQHFRIEERRASEPPVWSIGHFAAFRLLPILVFAALGWALYSVKIGSCAPFSSMLPGQ